MALAELITTRYPKDTLDIITFGDDAQEIQMKDLPYLKVGPYHTNTVAGLELAMAILRRRKNPNKQIMMITDGKPTCIKIGKKYYKNAFGMDRKIVNRTLALALACRKLHIPVTTFMVARDPYVPIMVKHFTARWILWGNLFLWIIKRVRNGRGEAGYTKVNRCAFAPLREIIKERLKTYKLLICK